MVSITVVMGNVYQWACGIFYVPAKLFLYCFFGLPDLTEVPHPQGPVSKPILAYSSQMLKTISRSCFRFFMLYGVYCSTNLAIYFHHINSRKLRVKIRLSISRWTELCLRINPNIDLWGLEDIKSQVSICWPFICWGCRRSIEIFKSLQ